MILGIDEVGRGPWAGPLVIGAVVLGGVPIEGLTDSKKLTKKRREVLYDEIYHKAAGVGLGWVTAGEIDEIGLGEALRLATKRAVKEVKAPFHEVIIDGTINFLVETPLENYVTTMKKADLLVPSVSAASIIAKVARDRYMADQDEVYPGYSFAAHVGYGTAAHRAAIEQLGVTPLHRLSFAPLAKYRTDTSNSGVASAQQQAQNRHKKSSRATLDSAELVASRRLKQSSNRKAALGNFFGISHIAAAPNPLPADGNTTAIGNASESVAAEDLVRRGHEIIVRNWKTKYCEIDIVSQKDGIYYFTEVKHRKNSRSGDGLTAITPKKLNQMKFAAKFYAHNNELEKSNLRLLAVATTGQPPVVTLVVEAD